MAKAADKHIPIDERVSVDDADRILRLDIGLRDGDALFELQEKFERGRLVLHWRCTDGSDRGQEGDVPSRSWGHQLRVARDPAPGAVDFATGRIRVPKNGVFVQQLTASVPLGAQELTVSMRDVRAIWGAAQSYPAPDQSPREPIVPQERQTETQHDRLIGLMKERCLKSGLLPREVRKAVVQPYKKKYHDEPSHSAVQRAYDEYTGAD
jgi:hypothetical protein